MGFGILNTSILAIYLLAMLGIGAFFSGRQRTTQDFFLAGRRLPWLAVAMSMYASVTSASTYLILPSKAYSENVAMIVASLISPLVAPLLIFLVYPVYRRMKVATSYEYIGARFGQGARQVVAILFVLARIGWLGTVLYAPSLALHVATGWSLTICILALGGISTIYTVMGGLSAVVWTDVVQFVVLVGGAFWVLITLVNNVPSGAAGIWRTASEMGRLKVFDLHLGGSGGGWNSVFMHMSVWSVALHFTLNMCHEYGTDQVTVQRLMAIRNDRGVSYAIFFNAVTDFLLIATLLFIGLGLLAFYKGAPGGLPELASPDQILPHFIKANLPAGVAGLIITAVLAAAMSSVDSGLNSLATVLELDLFRKWRTRDISEAEGIRLARIMTVLLGVLATAVAFIMADIKNILDGFSRVISMFNAPVLALFLLGMIWRRTSFRAWLVALGLTIPATFYINTYTKVDWSWRFPLAFAMVFAITVALSMLMPAAPTRAGSQPWRGED